MANTKITNPELFNLGDSTSATQLPVMTTTQRIAMTGLSVGEMIFNSTTDKVEYWDGTKWYGITYEVPVESPYNNVLYTGNGTSNSSEQSITGVGFQPDFVWIKNRGEGRNHVLVDSLRKTGSLLDELHSNDRDAANTTGTDNVKSLDSDGFTVLGQGSETNDSGDTFVAWCWKAGGAAVTNTDGTGTSQVSANVNSGFSIVTGSAPQNGYTNTFGHGLDQKPEMVITKLTNTASDWTVMFPDQSNGLMKLNDTGSFTYDSFFLTTATTLKTGYTSAPFDFVAYCFHSVAGVSKLGSYTGNGTTGQLISTGFQPRFLLVKGNANGGFYNWYMFDSKRGDAYFKADLASSEQSSPTYNPTFESTGFRWEPGDNSGGWNGSSITYVYMTFA